MNNRNFLSKESTIIIKNFSSFSHKKKIQEIKKNPDLFQFIDKKYWKNKTIVYNAVKKNGYLLQFVNDKLKDDKEIVNAAIQDYGLAIQFASDKLKDNKNLAIKAIKTFQ